MNEKITLKSVEDKIALSGSNNPMFEWIGEKGNSKKILKNSECALAKELRKYNVDGIEYKNGDVDFTPVSKYNYEFVNGDKLILKIGNQITIGDLMTDQGMKSRSDFNSKIRKEWQLLAKQEIIDKLKKDSQFAYEFQEKTGVNVSAVKSVEEFNTELRRNKLTLHETPDCCQIQFVPTIIHKSFKHSGGTAEMLERIIDGDTHGRIKLKEQVQKKEQSQDYSRVEVQAQDRINSREEEYIEEEQYGLSM